MDEIEQTPDQGEHDLKETIHEENKEEKHKADTHTNPDGGHSPERNPIHHGNGGR